MPIHRRQMLAAALAVPAGISWLKRQGACAGDRPLAPRADVHWLGEVQRPPDPPPTDAPILKPLLLDGQGRPVKTLPIRRQR